MRKPDSQSFTAPAHKPQKVAQNPGPASSPEQPTAWRCSQSTTQGRRHMKTLHADPRRDLLTTEVYFPVGSLQQKSLKNSEFAPRSSKQEHVARLFGKYPPQARLLGCTGAGPPPPGSRCLRSGGGEVLCTGPGQFSRRQVPRNEPKRRDQHGEGFRSSRGCGSPGHLCVCWARVSPT